MTYIDFFENCVVENLCACLAHAPERVILVGNKGKVLQRHAQRYQALFAARGQNVIFEHRAVGKNNLQSILATLEQLTEKYPDCAFGLTGGEDLYLVAVGILSQRHPERGIQMHRFNLQNGTFYDCDQFGAPRLVSDGLTLTVEENIRAYGGDVIFDSVRPGATAHWDMNDEFCRDIWEMWEICRLDVRKWNALVDHLKKGKGTAAGLTQPVPRRNREFEEFMDSLAKKGLLSWHHQDGDYLVTYKNYQVKSCLNTAGQVLELLIYLAALEAREDNGEFVYQDALSGVCIDWDGEIHPNLEDFDTENEVDVLLMHGVVPVFVSCKNGTVGMEELYKLSAVAERFGGKYGKKVLVTTALDKLGEFAEFFRRRAEDMHIRLVEGLQEKSWEDIRQTVSHFWQN